MIAHIRQKDGAEQSLCTHLKNVSALCSQYSVKIGLSKTAELLGLIHDMGKGTAAFRDYLRNQINDMTQDVYHHNHAPTGSIYIYENWFLPEEDQTRKTSAQILSLCVYGHHSGLMDCIDKNYKNCYESAEKMGQDKEKICYDEAVSYFLDNVANKTQLNNMFQNACDEIDAFLKKIRKFKSFGSGLLARLLLSILVDADRWDSACFEYGENPFTEKQVPDWNALLLKYENYANKTFTKTDEISTTRKKISDLCYTAANNTTGIYRLSVPTGGGKTFSSLRYALKHAAYNNLDRIFYVIPFNTILDQNAADIREALENYNGILEHHSNIFFDDDNEFTKHKRLTERWDSEIILTSMVQFLNSLFRKENTNTRRMHRLTNSVIIFDEVQALPKNCKALFEYAIRFLSSACHCTILLCTATQLELRLPNDPIELMGSVEELNQLHRTLKRVNMKPELKNSLTYEEAADKLFPLIQAKKSALMIVNTKAGAWSIFSHTCTRLTQAGYTMVPIQIGLKDDEIRELAKNSEKLEILCIHLSTLLCPAHRKEYIRWLQNWTKAGGNALCVSTALIEAGINVSFPVVVRSLVGLPSIVQAAGRCNRNMELKPALGDVYIWSIRDEDTALTKLPEIARGKAISGGLLNEWLSAFDSYDSLSEPNAIQLYYKKENCQTPKNLDRFPINTEETLVDLLSQNKARSCNELPLCQSFNEAGTAFEVIPDLTTSVLVPYREGEQLITQLNAPNSMKDEISLLRLAQQYSVNLYSGVYKRLSDAGALYKLGNTGIIALQPQYYDDQNGIMVEPKELETLIF